MMCWPVRVEPVKATLSTPGWLIAGLAAEARHDVDHARREAGLVEQVAQVQRRQRRLLGRFQDHRVAGGQCRRQLHHRHEQREVPRHDLADDADRLAQRVGQERPAHRHRLAAQLGRPAGVVAQRLHGQRQVHLAGVAKRLAGVVGLERGERGGVLLDEVGEAVQQALAIRGPHAGPGVRLEGRAGGLDGLVDVRRRALGHRAQGLAGGRVDVVEAGAIGSVLVVAVDEQARRRAELFEGNHGGLL
jgi:ParB family chromosome partitioning protein